MSHTTLISVQDLQSLQAASTPSVLLDCGFELADPAAGKRAHAAGHLPGAIYVHLDRDLAGLKTGHNGRHPLPERSVFAARVGGFCIRPGIQVVCYDDQGGVYAARAWWMLRWLGHAEVAVLDGGRAAWIAAGGALLTGAAALQPQTQSQPQPQSQSQPQPQPPYPAKEPAMATLDATTLHQQLGRCLLLDARAPERFRGEVEPLDPVAGHIPGATNRFFKNNLAADGRFKPAAQLRAEFLSQGVTADVVHQCGSGVTACHNLLAMEHAGLPAGALYPGSWSEWSSDPARPVARG